MVAGNNVDNKRGVTVNKGDSITVSAMGIKVTGIVATVDHWGDRAGWQIEIAGANVPGGYSSWKQRDDGGWISALNGQPMGKNFKTEGNVLTVFNEDDSVAFEGSYERDNGGRFILKERPWSTSPGDAHLTCVLAYYAMKNEFVTWMYNTEFSSTNEGNYFVPAEYDRAMINYEGRNIT